VWHTIVREAEQQPGSYASVLQSGRVAVGDVVELRWVRCRTALFQRTRGHTSPLIAVYTTFIVRGLQ